MKTIKLENIKEARKIMRGMDDMEKVYFFGSCQVQKFGSGCPALNKKRGK